MARTGSITSALLSIGSAVRCPSIQEVQIKITRYEKTPLVDLSGRIVSSSLAVLICFRITQCVSDLHPPGPTTHLLSDHAQSVFLTYLPPPPAYSSVDGCMVIPADDDTVGAAEVRAALLSSPAVQASLVPDRWVENAYRHIVWKLAAYERQFPDEMAGRYVGGGECGERDGGSMGCGFGVSSQECVLPMIC